jgi:hypothetical protein
MRLWYPVDRCKRWLEVVLILPIGRSVCSNLSVLSCRHFHDLYPYLEELLKICILYFFSIGCYVTLLNMIGLWVRGACSLIQLSI